MRIVLLGAPGVGKGTQAQLICEYFKIPRISTGDMFRSNIKEKTPLGIKAKDYIDNGELVPDELTISIIKDTLDKEHCSNGFILDGFPRNINQAKELELLLARNNQKIDKVILIDIENNSILERIAGRRFCTSCGRSYHIKSNPSKLKEKCEACKAKLIQREDDKQEVVLNRLTIYDKAVKPLIDYYSAMGTLCKVKGNGTINDIFHSICIHLNS